MLKTQKYRDLVDKHSSMLSKDLQEVLSDHASLRDSIFVILDAVDKLVEENLELKKQIKRQRDLSV